MFKIKKERTVKLYIQAVLFAMFSTFCFVVKNGTYQLTKERMEALGGFFPAQLNRFALVFSSPSSVCLLLFVLLFVAYLVILQRINLSHCIISTILAVCYALLILLSESYYKFNNWSCVFGNGFAFFTSMLRGAGIGIFFFFVMQILFAVKLEVKEKNKHDFLKSFLKVFGIFLICWLPYMIIMFPGIMNPDTRDQVAQITNNTRFCFTARMIEQNTPDFLWNNNHPVLFTLILKGFVFLGGKIGSFAWGFELYAILQSIAFAGTIAYLLTKLFSYGYSKKIITGFVVFFALNPLLPLWGMTIMKDIPFTIFLVLSCIWLYEIVSGKRKGSIVSYVMLGFSLLLMMMFRNNGFYMALLAIPFLIFLLWKEKKKMFGLCGTFLIALFTFKVLILGMLFTHLGIGAGSVGEMYSVPFQQTARYIKEYRSEVTKEEEQAILAVLNTGGTLDEIADLYVPFRADQVKAKFNSKASGTEMKKYIQVWFSQFFKHPTVYVEAYINLVHCWFGMEGMADNIYYSDVDPYIEYMLPGVKQPEALSSARAVVNGITKVLDFCPLTSWLLEFSVYTWIYIALFVIMLINKKREAFLTAIMLFANYLICLAGPVGYMRYALPMIVCLPLVILLTFQGDRVSEDETEGE